MQMALTLIKEGLDNGDIIQDGRVYYTAEEHKAKMSQKTEKCSHSAVAAEGHGKSLEFFQDMADKLMGHDWAAWALLNTRVAALPPSHDEDRSTPPSEEALAHLNTSIERAQKLGRDIRTAAQSVSRDNASKGHGSSGTSSSLVNSTLNKLDAMEPTTSLHCRT